MKKFVVGASILVVIAALAIWYVHTPKAWADDSVCSGFHVRSYYVNYTNCNRTVENGWVKIKCTAHNPPHESDWLQSGADGFVCTGKYHYRPICLVHYSDLHTGYWYVLSNNYEHTKSSSWIGPYYLNLGSNSVDVLAYVQFTIGK